MWMSLTWTNHPTKSFVGLPSKLTFHRLLIDKLVEEPHKHPGPSAHYPTSIWNLIMLRRSHCAWRGLSFPEEATRSVWQLKILFRLLQCLIIWLHSITDEQGCVKCVRERGRGMFRWPINSLWRVMEKLPCRSYGRSLSKLIRLSARQLSESREPLHPFTGGWRAFQRSFCRLQAFIQDRSHFNALLPVF